MSLRRVTVTVCQLRRNRISARLREGERASCAGSIDTNRPADEGDMRREGNVRARCMRDGRSTRLRASRGRHRIGRSVTGLAACTLLFSLLPGTLASAAGPRASREAREVRSIWTDEFGLSRPIGLTYLPGRDELLVAGRAGNGTSMLRLSLVGDPQGTFRLPGLSAPGTLAFDSSSNLLTALSDGNLVTAGAHDLTTARPEVSRSTVSGLGLRNPQAAAFDPGTGTWFILEEGGNAVTIVPAEGDPARLSLAALPGGGFGAIAFNPTDGLLYVASSDESLLYALDGSGRVRKTYAMASLGVRNLSAMTFAPSADPTDDPATLHLYLADAGNAKRLGGVVETTLTAAPTTSAPVVTATLVQRIDTPTFSPPSPDPSGIVYLPALDQLMISDSEVDETTGAGYHGVNLWRITRTGAVQDTGTTVGFSNEPTGLGFDAGSNTLFISDDDGNRIHLLKPGPDGRWGNGDDTRTFISTAVCCTDVEDPEYDPSTGHLFFIDGVSTEVYDIDPVNGVFGDGNDVMTHFDVGQYGATDIEGLGSDPAHNTLLVGNRPTRIIYEVTKAGALVRTIDASRIPGMANLSGLAWAPASDNSGRTDYWIVDRAVDNGANSNENDGKIFEISVPGSDALPTVTLTSPVEGATVTGQVQVQANASDDHGVTQVEFRVDGTSIGTDTTAPYSAGWTTTSVGDGPHTVTAIATDTIGQTASDANGVTVDNLDGPPSVTLTAPAEGATVAGQVQIQADASDDHGVTQVVFRVDGTSIGTDTTAPYAMAWDTTAGGGGPHTVEAVATDTIGQTGADSNAVTVDNTPPSVAITSPSAGATVSGTVPVQANASDNGTVGSVQFFSDGASIGTDTNGADGWSVSWNTVAAGNGSRSLTAAAKDLGNNSTTSAPVQVTVSIPSVLDVPVASGLDDVEEGPTGTINQTSTDLDMITDGTTIQRAVGLRFTGVGIPQGATIANAYIQFRANETQSEATSLTVKGQAADNAAAFAGGNSNVTNRPVTTASATWSPAAWTAGQRGAAQQTPNLSSVLQEIVGRPGWSPGNAIVLIVTGTGKRVADSFEAGAAGIPVLHIESGPVDAPPTVTLTSPVEGATVTGQVQVQANASDDHGVTQVEFRVDGTSIGTDTTAPYSAGWTTTSVGDGPHTVTAIATDTIGQTASDANGVTVDNLDGPPSVTLTAPAEGATVAGQVQIQADASDDHGVTQVVFRVDGTSIGTDTTAPYAMAWDTTAGGGGPHTVEAVATDTIGQTGADSNAVTVDNTPPSVAITSPSAGATVSGTVPVQANASDNGTVGSVQFFSDGASIGTDTNGADGWSVSWNTVAAGNGSRSLTAVAKDLGNNSTTSAPVQVTVSIPSVLDVPVASGLDDVEEGPTGTINQTSTDLDMITDGTTIQRAVGLRFTGVGIPQGATIANAYIQFRANETQSEATSLTVKGQAADNAAAFAGGNSNVTNRPVTTASATWSPAAWTAGQRGAAQQTPNLSSVLQEIVGRPGWSPGNAIVLIVTGTGKRVADSFEAGAAGIPVLHIESGPVDAPPTVTLTSPVEGATVTGQVQVQANASDDHGVTQVEFRVDGTSIGTDTTAPYSAGWTTTSVGDGPHTVTAIATDTIGQTASDANGVTVDNLDGPPSVTLTAPAEGATVAGQVQIQADASDDHGVTQVVFRVDGTSIGTDTTAPYAMAWDTTAGGGGPHTVEAVATDTIGQTGADSNAVTVDNTPPSVAITSPSAGATVSGTVPVQANASDNGTVGSVQFFSDGASIGTDTNGADGWSVSWNTVAAGNGSRSLTAVAADTAGNTTTSAPVQVTVGNALAFDIPVATSSDDAEQKTTNNSVRINSSDLELVTDKTVVQLVGMRFTGINLPRGAIITNAYVQFQASKTDSAATSLTVRGQAADSPATFTTANSNISSRPLTTASIPWTPLAWTQGARGAAQRTPNLGAVLQEIVNRPGWSPGNAAVLIISGTGVRRAEAFDSGAALAPVLHIEYQVA